MSASLSASLLGGVAGRSCWADDRNKRSLSLVSQENKTRLVGEVKNTAIKPKNKRNIILAGVVGLMMSLFLAFFIEYLGNVREMEREKEKDDSV